MLVCVCLVGSNLNIYAKPENIRPSQQYNYHFNSSYKGQNFVKKTSFNFPWDCDQLVEKVI